MRKRFDDATCNFDYDCCLKKEKILQEEKRKTKKRIMNSKKVCFF